MGQGRGAGGGRRQAAGAGGQAGRRRWPGAGASVGRRARGRGGAVARLWGGRGERLSQARGAAGGWLASPGFVRRRSLLRWRRRGGRHRCCRPGWEAADSPPSQAWAGAPLPCGSSPLPALLQRGERRQHDFPMESKQGHCYGPERVLMDPAPHPLGGCRRHQLLSFPTTLSSRHGGVCYPENVILVINGTTMSHPKHQCPGCCGGREIGH